MAGTPASLVALNIEQLQEAKEKLQEDVQKFAQSMAFLSKSSAIYTQSGGAIKELEDAKQGEPLREQRRRQRSSDHKHNASLFHSAGQQVLLPLTQSLYVTGELDSVDRVLIDIGTGYFVEVGLTRDPNIWIVC